MIKVLRRPIEFALRAEWRIQPVQDQLITKATDDYNNTSSFVNFASASAGDEAAYLVHWLGCVNCSYATPPVTNWGDPKITRAQRAQLSLE
ncbi:MAG: hypothetical protein ABR507_06380 [Actinomycetota bacterium]|nr:hypothetical protein [Actinomycetota bacterium]